MLHNYHVANQCGTLSSTSPTKVSVLVLLAPSLHRISDNRSDFSLSFSRRTEFVRPLLETLDELFLGHLEGTAGSIGAEDVILDLGLGRQAELAEVAPGRAQQALIASGGRQLEFRRVLQDRGG